MAKGVWFMAVFCDSTSHALSCVAISYCGCNWMVVAGLWKKSQGAVSMNETLCHVCHCCVVLWWESKGFLAAEFSRVAKDAYVHQ